MRFLWRWLVVICACGLLATVVTSAEQARATASTVGRALGIVARDVRLTEIADAALVRASPPTHGDLAFTRAAVAAAPLAPLPFFILGISGQARDPAAAVAASLRRDPRFVAGYRWQAATAARRGAVADATSALIRVGVLTPFDQTIFPALAQLAADPAARAVISKELARQPAWRDTFLAALGSSSVDRAIVFAMLESAGKHPAATNAAPRPDVPPDDRRVFIAAMIARKDYERAYLAWFQWLPQASQAGVGHVFDSDFKGLAALPPFSWTLTDGIGGAAAILPESGFTLDYSGTDGAVVAQQMLLLAPGRYRIVTTAHFNPVTNENGVAPLVWSLTCADDSHGLASLAVPLTGTARSVGSPPFEVAAGCDAQRLSLRVNSADFAKHLSGTIRRVSVETVR